MEHTAPIAPDQAAQLNTTVFLAIPPNKLAPPGGLSVVMPNYRDEGSSTIGLIDDGDQHEPGALIHPK